MVISTAAHTDRREREVSASPLAIPRRSSARFADSIQLREDRAAIAPSLDRRRRAVSSRQSGSASKRMPPASRRTSGMPDFDCRPETAEERGRLRSRRLRTRAAPSAAGSTGGTPYAERHASDCNGCSRPCLSESRRAGGTRPPADGGGDRAAVRLSDHELHGRHLDRGGGSHRLRTACDAEDDAGAGGRTELSGVDRRESLRAARKHHRPAPGRADVLVLRDDLHLHSRHQLGRPRARRRHHRVGPPDRRGLQDRSAALSRRQRRPQHDARDGADVLRALDLSGRCRKSAFAGWPRSSLRPRGKRRGCSSC